MRKFTKILTRHIKPHDTSSNSSSPKGSTDHLAAAPLYEAPCFHQLSSSRLAYGGGKPVRRAPPLSSSRIVADEVHELMCTQCASIDFPRLLDWRPGNPRPWIGLSHVLEEEGEPGCPYCAFFRALLEGGGGSVGKFAPYLRIRLAFERLGVREKHELGGAVLIEVMARNKSLPWGYVVKAAEEEGTGMDGYLGTEKGVGIKGRTVTPMLDPELAKLWLNFCKEKHPGCGKQGSLVEGMKLVDVEDRRVVSAQDIEGESPPEYAALSYVWGEGTWGETLGEDAALPEDVPPLIADAISFTKQIGFRYLWVDRYCYFQLEDEDKRRHLDRMGDIFAQSALTLVVAAGDGVSEGIPGVSVHRDPQLSLKTETGLFTTTLLRPDLEVSSSAWASRGWTYQEGLLSRRRLVFTSSQVYFQCQSLHCHESLSMPLELATGLNLGRVFPESGAGTQPDSLKNHIKAYIGKDHADPADRLNAFEGILQHYRHIDLPVNSFLGLPLFHPDSFTSDKPISQTDLLAVGLGWLPNRIPHPSQSSTIPPTPYIPDPSHTFPSWTWLAWRLRPGHSPLSHAFHFHLVENETSISNVCAAPQTEISIGYQDEEEVLSWETDADAIKSKTAAGSKVSFLRINSYTFPIAVKTDGENVSLAGATLNRTQRDLIKGWFRLSAGSIPDGEYELTAVLLSGRNWRVAGDKEATVLVCAREGWREDGRLVRLGALGVSFVDFTRVTDGDAVMEGVAMDNGDRGDIHVRLRETDIY